MSSLRPSARRTAPPEPIALPPALDRAVRTALCLLVLPAALAALSVCAMVLAMFGAPRAWIDRIYTSAAWLCVWVAGTRLEVRGLENVQAGQAYVVVPNHESDWDPVALIAALRGHPLRAVIKDQAARIPILGRALLLTGNIRVERTDTASDVARIRERMAARPPDVSILFYAEGTRSRDGRFQPFKKGAFATAIAYGLPVLPIGTAGTRRLWPPLTLQMRSGPVVIEIGRSIRVDGLTLADRDRLRDETHSAVRMLRARARTRLRARGVELE